MTGNLEWGHDIKKNTECKDGFYLVPCHILHQTSHGVKRNTAYEAQ